MLMHTKTETYKQGRLTFLITEDRILVQTSLPQTFYLEPTMHYWQRRYNLIRTMISLGEIRSLQELAEWCGVGIAWISTNERI